MMFTLSTFYKSDEWESFRKVVIFERLNDQGETVCEYCHKPVVKKYDIILHHKQELTESNVNDYNVSLNPDNIMLIHHRCHNQIHERFGYQRARNVYIVYGSPCSGKTTWVHENAGDNDLILDIDAIWQFISVCDKFHKPNRLKENMFGIRDCILEQIKMRVGKWQNAYVIGGYPNKHDRERLADLLGAQLIFIDTEQETCVSRAPNDEWIRFIEDWFDDFIP